jgi:hypothetical protein
VPPDAAPCRQALALLTSGLTASIALEQAAGVRLPLALPAGGPPRPPLPEPQAKVRGEGGAPRACRRWAAAGKATDYDWVWPSLNPFPS